MTTLNPRSPYSDKELGELYPQALELQLVQVLLRHGERSPVSPRFQNTGLQPYWPYCNVARSLASSIMENPDPSQWGTLKYRRRLETFGPDDGPMVASGPSGEFDAICQPGELTDTGRQSTLALGQRLRNLYVNQLKFMPTLISDSDMIYLRATPIPRALESVQQTFYGLYPPSARTADFPAPTILTRTPADETLFPNDSSCRRFAQLSRAFAQRTADRWNGTDDMKYLNKLLSKWMPEGSGGVAVDSRPRLSGIMDTINSTLAHGPETRLPKEFYDEKARKIIDKIGVEEWFSGYTESVEYRKLGIGGLMGDVVSRMTGSVERIGTDGIEEVGGDDGHTGRGRGGETDIRLALSGCHDTTLAAALSSLGAFDGESWPPYTSHVAFELFRDKSVTLPKAAMTDSDSRLGTLPTNQDKETSWWSKLFGGSAKTSAHSGQQPPMPKGIARKPLEELTQQQRDSLKGYYVRVRYNDQVMKVPACSGEGKNWNGDASFCTLTTFKAVVDKYVPKNWKRDCMSDLGAASFPPSSEPAGYDEARV